MDQHSRITIRQSRTKYSQEGGLSPCYINRATEARATRSQGTTALAQRALALYRAALCPTCQSNPEQPAEAIKHETNRLRWVAKRLGGAFTPQQVLSLVDQAAEDESPT